MKLLNFFKKEKPNIIMIFIDGAARQDALQLVPYYGELKKISMTFSSLITYAPYSIASLNAVISGMYGNVNGVDGYYKAYNFDKKNILTLTQYLKEAGYHTEMDFVLGDAIPPEGFDKIRAFGADTTKELDLIRRHTEILTQLKEKQPFFVFFDYNKIALNLVNSVIRKYDDFSEEYFKKKKENFKRYLEWVKESGVYIKSILDHIKNLGIYDNSLIILFNDHGCSVGDKIGEKVYGVYLYDYSIKCTVWLIGKSFPKNLEIKKVVRTIDLMPTILEVLGIPQKKEGYKPIQGKSLMPYIYGKEENDRTAYSETGGLGGPTPSPKLHNVQSVRTEKWKLVYNKTNKKRELYNLDKDPEENNNLAGKGLEIEDWLWKEMQKINEEHDKINYAYKDKKTSQENIQNIRM